MANVTPIREVGTIRVSQYISIQGNVVGETPEGLAIVECDGKQFTGTKIPSDRRSSSTDEAPK